MHPKTVITCPLEEELLPKKAINWRISRHMSALKPVFKKSMLLLCSGACLSMPCLS